MLQDAVGRQPLQPYGGPLCRRANGVAQAGIALVHDPVEQAGDLLRAGTALLIVRRPCQRSRERFAVSIRRHFGELAILRKRRLVVPRLDDHHANTKRPYLHPQCFGQAFQGEFGSAVHGLVRNRDHSADRADIHDVAAALAAHGGQHRAANPQSAKEIDFELLFGFLD